jgi:uncharacterized RDD family membrane protein YckC
MTGKTLKKNRQNNKGKKSTSSPTIIYAGFWPRFLALCVDIFMIGIPISILIYLLFGYETMQNQPGFMDAIEGINPSKEPNPLIPLLTMGLWSLITLAFWHHSAQTPGKKMAHIIIVDSVSFRKATLGQLVVRLLFFIMPIFAFVSFFVMLFHPKKRTLHDIISRTAVIYTLRLE